MKTKLKRFGAWLMAAALAFAGAGAYGATVQVADQTELNAAVKEAAAGDVIEITVAGTYKVPSPTSAIKIVGVDGVVFNAIDTNYGQSVGQATGTEFVNVKFAFGTSLYTGFQHSSYVAFTKCSFTGRFNSYGEMHFTECSFEAPSSDYSMWLYAGDTYFKDCTFSGNGKFFNVYNEGNTSVPWIVEFDGCTFSSTAKNKAALNVKSTCGSKGLKYDVKVNNCTVNENFPAASVSDTLIVFNGLIQLDDISASTPNEITITQDGKVLYADNEVAGPEVAIKEPTKEEVVEQTKGEATTEQKTEKAVEVVAVIAKAVEEEALEVAKSGLSAAGKTADGKLADPLVTALKAAAREEKKAEITNETKVKKTIDVVFKGMTVEAGEKVTTTKIAYDVTPKATATLADGTEVKATIPNDTFEKINFRMPLTADFAGRWLKVSRTDDDTTFEDVGLYLAQKDGDVDFVQIDGDHFTTYVNEITDETPVASINGKGYMTLADAVAAAEDGQTIKVIKPDTYKLPDFTAQVTLESVEGVAYNCKDDLAHDGKQVCGIAKPVVFKGGSFDFGEHIYRGFIYKTGSWQDVAAKVTFDSAYFKGIICGHGDLEFKNCTIEQISSGQYPIRSWGSPTITVTGCTFLTGGRAILVYREGYPNSQQTVNVSDCHFLTKEGQTIDSKGAVQVNPADVGTVHYDVNIDGCDASEAYTGLWDVKLVSGKGPNALILIDGDQVYPEPVAQIGTKKYSTLAQALAAVQNNETVKLLKSGNVITEYAKQIGEKDYSEDVGQNRLSFGTDAKFTLDLNGNTLCGRINFLKGDMTVTNGTLTAQKQVLNIFGSKDPADKDAKHTTVTVAPTAVVKGGWFALCVFGGNPDNVYWPIGFGETLNVYGRVVAEYSAIQSSGNIGMDTYEANIGKSAEVEAVTNALGMSVSAMMAKYGPVINVYDGAELATVPGETEDSSQGISSQGMATYNIHGGKISGAEAIGIKGGIVNVMGGEMTAFGVKANPVEAVNSGTEVSGGGIAISTSYNGNSPIVVNVTGGTIKSANNAALLFEHSYDKANDRFCPVVKGVTFNVSGGTFIGAKDELAIKVEDAIEGDAATYPANFISAKLDEEGKETGYPLCNSPIPAEYIAVGYKEKDNENKTWTVTAVSQEIVVDPTPIAPEDKKYVGDDGQPKEPTEAEKTAADKAVKEVEAVYQEQVLTKVEGTGIAGVAVDIQSDGQRTLKSTVVTALQEKAPAGVEITPADGSNSWSHLVIKLKSTTTKIVTETATIKTSVNEMKVDVKPIIEVTPIRDGVALEPIETDLPQSEIPPEGITFPLFVSEAFRGKWALVKHENDPVYETEVLEDEKNRPFVVVTATHFSEWLLSVIETSSMTVKRADGKGYDSFAEAIADTTTAADETFTLLKDTEEVVKLGAKQTIVTDGHTFGGIHPSVLEADLTEQVNTDGKVFIAPVKANVPVSDEEGAPVIRVRMRAEGVTTPEENVAALKAIQANQRPLWQNMALGVANNFKLIPMIPRSAIGFKTIKICSNLDDATLAAAAKQRDGVAVKFQLLKKVGAGDYVQCGEVQDKPVFNVEADDLEPRTFWKIQTIFSEEY